MGSVTEIGFGIVGAGMVARYHARAIAETPGARLAAICRADAVRADEAVVAALCFSSDARGTIVATTAAAPGFPHRVEIYGSRGGAQIEGDVLVRWEGAPRMIHPQVPPAVAAGSGASPTGIGILGHTLIVQDFVAAIREGRDPLVNGAEGRRSLALVLAIYEAAGLGARS